MREQDAIADQTVVAGVEGVAGRHGWAPGQGPETVRSMVYGPRTMDRLLELQRESVRALSGVLFGGAQYRLEVCGALQSDERITAAGLAERLGNPPGKASVHVEVQRLEQAGLLERLPRIPGDRHAYFRVHNSALWDAARELAAAAREVASRQYERERAVEALSNREADR